MNLKSLDKPNYFCLLYSDNRNFSTNFQIGFSLIKTFVPRLKFCPAKPNSNHYVITNMARRSKKYKNISKKNLKKTPNYPSYFPIIQIICI